MDFIGNKVTPLPQRTKHRNRRLVNQDHHKESIDGETKSSIGQICGTCNLSPPIQILESKDQKKSKKNPPMTFIAACLVVNETNTTTTTTTTTNNNNNSERIKMSFTEIIKERSDLFVPFMRSLLLKAPLNYHMCIIPYDNIDHWFQGSKWNHGWSLQEIQQFINTSKGSIIGNFIIFVFGHNEIELRKAPTFIYKNDDPILFTDRSGKTINPGVTFGEIIVGNTINCSTMLDAQGRAMYITVMNRQHIVSMEQLNDEELYDLFKSSISVSEPNNCTCCSDNVIMKETSGGGGGGGKDHFIDIRINKGIFQNIGHLHMKTSIISQHFFNSWRLNSSWIKLVSSTPNQRLLNYLKKHIKSYEKKENRNTKKQDEFKYWTTNSTLRAKLNLQKKKEKTSKEMSIAQARAQAQARANTKSSSKATPSTEPSPKAPSPKVTPSKVTPQKIINQRPTHFLSIRLPCKKLKNFCESIQNLIINCNVKLKDAATSSNKLHLTLFVLTLNNQNEINTAKKILQSIHSISKDIFQYNNTRRTTTSIAAAAAAATTTTAAATTTTTAAVEKRENDTDTEGEVKEDGHHLPSLHLKGLKLFNKCSVLYMNVEENEDLKKLTELVENIYQLYVENGLIKNYNEKKKSTFTPHCTIMKMSKMKKKRKKKINRSNKNKAEKKEESISKDDQIEKHVKAERKEKVEKLKLYVPNEYEHFDFGDHIITEIELCEMKTNENTGYYVIQDVVPLF
jgi:2'-5' RNA ligase